jgi:hypothetical protein
MMRGELFPRQPGKVESVMLRKQRETDAERALTQIIRERFEPAALAQIKIHPGVDHAGEPALFVSVRLKSGKERLAPDKSVDLQIAMRDALQEINDDRFPYLTFSAPDDDLAQPEARKSA